MMAYIELRSRCLSGFFICENRTIRFEDIHKLRNIFLDNVGPLPSIMQHITIIWIPLHHPMLHNLLKYFCQMILIFKVSIKI